MHSHSDQSLLTPQQCRLLLSDIACCSLMRLDIASMDKLWDLMVMVFKWQMANIKDSQRLLDTTFRHMDGIGRLIPESKKTYLIDFAKRNLIEFWDNINDTNRDIILKTIIKWLNPFNVKISILIRLGFQRLDTTFDTECKNEHFNYYADNIGENIYIKHANLTSIKLLNDHKHNMDKQKLSKNNSHELETLVTQLNINHTNGDEKSDNFSGGGSGSSNNNNSNNLLDDVLFSVESKPMAAGAASASDGDNVMDDDIHQFLTVPQVKTTLQCILEQFRNECTADEQFKNSDNTNNEINITDELLKMLDEKDD